VNRQSLLAQSTRLGCLSGGILAVYIALTVFWQMPYEVWLALHNLLVVTSLLVAAFIGYKHSALKASFGLMMLSVVALFAVIMVLYLGSYFVTTAFFADYMVWIPFFYHDYNHHGFQSVSAYLKQANSFRELLELQIFSFLIGSVMYLAAGSVGYAAKSMIDGIKKASNTAQSIL
jgi:hypothetical protein